MAYDFDGSGDYITPFSKGAAATDLQDFTYSFSLIRDAGGSNKNVFWSGGPWSDNFHSFLQYDNGLSKLALVTNWSGAEARWSVPNTADDTAWHNHVVGYSYSATTNDPIWYIDGVSQTVSENVTPSGTSNHTTDDGNIAIGAGHDGSYEYWDGKIAEFAIWNRVLTAGEAAVLGKGFSPLFIPNGLVFYAPLIRGANNLKGGTTGTVVNAIVFPHPRIIYPSGYFIAPFAPSITLDSTSSGQNDGASSITVSHTVSGSNKLLVVCSSAEDNTNAAHLPITGITYGGVALTKAVHQEDAAGENDRTEIWYLVGPATGTADVVVSYTDVVDGCVVGVQSYNGVSQTGAYDTSTSTTATSTGPAEVAITTAEANELLVDAAQTLSSSRTLAINSGQTANYNIQNAGQLRAAGSYEVVGAAGSYTQGYTIDANADWIICVAAFKPVGAVIATTFSGYYGSAGWF